MIQNNLNGMGIAGRDSLLEDEFGWVDQVYLQDLYTMLRYPLARRVVTDGADQITEAGIRVSASGVNTNQIDELEAYLREHTKTGSLHDALVNASAFGMGAEILVVDDGRELHEPVDEANIRDVIAVVPSHRWELTPYAWASNIVVKGADGRPTVNQHYQEPVIYSYTPWMYGSDIGGRGGDWLDGPEGDPWTKPSWDKIKAGTMIHASRVCAYPGAPLPNLLQRDNGGFADPILRQCKRPILAWYGHVHHASDAGRHLSELVYTGDRLTQAIDTPMSGVQTAEQAQRYLANIVAQQQSLSSYRGVRMLSMDEKLEYLAKPMTGFDQLTQVIMIDCALSAGIPLENLFMVSPPGGIGAGGAGRFIWDNYERSIRIRFSGHVYPQRSKLYRYAALASNGPIAEDIKLDLELGILTRETLKERAERKLAEYQALAEAQVNSWVDPREVRAREKATGDSFITLDDKYDADLQKPGTLDLTDMMAPAPAPAPIPAEVPADGERTDADGFNESDHKRDELGKFASYGSHGKKEWSAKLYRASNHETSGGGTTSFGRERSTAEAYMDNPGFGGSRLFETEITGKHGDVFDLHGLSKDQAMARLIEESGIKDPGATTADVHIAGNLSTAEKLRDKGYKWARVSDTFPEGAETWIHLGGGNDPELKDITPASQAAKKGGKPKWTAPKQWTSIEGPSLKDAVNTMMAEVQSLKIGSRLPAWIDKDRDTIDDKESLDEWISEAKTGAERALKRGKMASDKTIFSPEYQRGWRADAAELPSNWHGIPLVLTHRAGEERHGRPLPAHYGYLLGVTGADGDDVDVLAGPDMEQTTAYVVEQMTPSGATFDEHKVMLGYASHRQAVIDYLIFAPSLDSMGTVHEVPADELVQWMEVIRPARSDAGGKFEESKHPRAEDGKFGSGSGSGSETSETGPTEAKKGAQPTTLDPSKVSADTGYADYTKAMKSRGKKPLKESAHRQMLVTKHLGVDKTDAEIAGMIGVTDAKSYKVSIRGDAIQISIEHDGYTMKRSFTRDEDGKVVCNNDYFEVTGDRGKGQGSKVFGQQVESLRANGVDRMTTHASRQGEEGKTFNGYYTWPRLGYNGDIPDSLKASMPAGLKGAKDIHDLMGSKEGRDWWKENGDDVNVSFDLDPDSVSSRVFSAYQKERAK